MPSRPRRGVEVWIQRVDNRFGWGVEMRLGDQELRATHEETGRRLAELVNSPIV